MNHGPLLFLATFVSLVASWFGLVLMPHIQFGRQQVVKIEETGQLYPGNPPGESAQGAQIYRANGCNYCHSQQLRATGLDFKLVLTETGTNATALLKALTALNPDQSSGVGQLAAKLPRTLLVSRLMQEIDLGVQSLTNAGAKAQRGFAFRGPDLERGWGMRQTVAQDFLQEYPVMLGSSRLGPDLASVGTRPWDAQWHYRHLYKPRSEVTNSPMPQYTYLFEKRAVKGPPSADALKLPADYQAEVGDGFEVVPTAEARQLVAYLLSRRVDTSLPNAPLPFVPKLPVTMTNAPGATNAAAATNPPSAK